MLLRLRLISGSLVGGLLLLLLLCLGAQNLEQRTQLNLLVGRSAPLPVGFVVGLALVVGVISGGCSAALASPQPDRSND
ncbi:MAG: hypothetical protein VKL97_00705 [Cyanobacteriota bacterium]|nr:hypothetical protein [Cyanobacteriota bacterium]